MKPSTNKRGSKHDNRRPAILVRLPGQLLEQLDIQAKKQKRSRTKMLEFLIEEYLGQRSKVRL